MALNWINLYKIQSHDYFGAEGQDKIDYVERLQILCQSFNLMKLNEINDKIEACSEVEQAKCLVDEKVFDCLYFFIAKVWL